MIKLFLFIISLVFNMLSNYCQVSPFALEYATDIKVGAEQTSEYLTLLKGKKVGIVANHTSFIGQIHLVDSLISLNIDVVKIFSPEHGFRGKASAGEKINSSIDEKTKLPIVSLYGNNKKPKPEQIQDLDLIIFDIQDVGARFYTYISTMHYVMEACAENKIPLIILDRPNPNGHYVDGPVLEKEFRSFVGMHEVPIVHGMTIGEYAQMINGEKWLDKQLRCDLTIIHCLNYNHSKFYKIPIPPSPNLPNMAAIYLYPTLCLFEGTNVSVGRGTDLPFQIIGSPFMKSSSYTFTPKKSESAKWALHADKVCNGYNLTFFGNDLMRDVKGIYLYWLQGFYANSSNQEDFFLANGFFNKLAGNRTLQEDIKTGKSITEIMESWQPKLLTFKTMRKKYLLYPDFE